jgi:carbonic anhydrase
MTSFPPRLIAGYRNFVSGDFERQKSRYKQLADAGQKPDAMIIACCDSRVAPETVFNCGPGELFVVRNVANLVPPYTPDDEYHGTSAALEFAVQALRIRNIVVMGHGRCGGIKAALDPATEPLSPGDFIGKWVSLLSPAAAAVADATSMTAAQRQTALEQISIRNSIANLRTFPCISILEARGELLLHGAWFDIASGELRIMNADGDFIRPDRQADAGWAKSG